MQAKRSEIEQARLQRNAQKRLRELERQAKEQAKLSALEQARLEVETYESGLEVLLSVHKEQVEFWDWIELVATLPPHAPCRFSRHELKAKLRTDSQTLAQASARDEQEFQERLQAHAKELGEWKKINAIARRILAGEPKAYTEALVHFSALAEISELGSSIHFTVHNAKLLECVLKVSGRQAIPNELITLTSAGRVSVKPMPKARFHEIYQDYVCGCVLRVAREVFALLPIDTVLLTASADMLDPQTGHTVEQPVLSVAMSRAAFGRLDFEHLDPSDAMENFPHRGDAKASRKTGAFERITPLTAADLALASPENMDFRELLATVRRVRDELRSEIEKFSPQPAAASPPPQSS